MSTVWIVVLALVAWFALSVVVALVVGPVLRARSDECGRRDE